MKKLISIILIAVVVISCLGIMGSAASSKKSYWVTCKTAADVLDFTLEGGKHAVPIRVVKAGLRKDGVVSWIYLVTLVFCHNLRSRIHFFISFDNIVKTALHEEALLGNVIQRT